MINNTRARQMLEIALQIEPEGDNAMLLLSDATALAVHAGGNYNRAIEQIRESAEALDLAEVLAGRMAPNEARALRQARYAPPPAAEPVASPATMAAREKAAERVRINAPWMEWEHGVDLTPLSDLHTLSLVPPPSAAPTTHHPRHDITDDLISQWAEDRADDAGALARRVVALRGELSAMKADRPYIIGYLHEWDAAVEGGEAHPSAAPALVPAPAAEPVAWKPYRFVREAPCGCPHFSECANCSTGVVTCNYCGKVVAQIVDNIGPPPPSAAPMVRGRERDLQHRNDFLRGRLRQAEALTTDNTALVDALMFYENAVRLFAGDWSAEAEAACDALIEDKGAKANSALASRPAAPAEGDVGAWADVLAERQRQMAVEGWTPEHDDEHWRGEMALAAACYAIGESSVIGSAPPKWPWDDASWKPKDCRRNLVRAGGLILAEIERLDRAALRPQSSAQGGER